MPGKHTKQSKHQPSNATKLQGKELDFDFDVEDFYCLGSPIGLFQMLKGRNILGRHQGFVLLSLSSEPYQIGNVSSNECSRRV